MITPTVKIKKQARNATRSDRGAAKSTVKACPRTPEKAVNNEWSNLRLRHRSLNDQGHAAQLVTSWTRSTPTGEQRTTFRWGMIYL